MPASALLKFTQGATVGGDGHALIGTVGTLVTLSNVDNTVVASWQIDLAYVDPSSSLTITTAYAFSNNNSTPAASFTPDVRRSYRWVLKVWSVANRTGNPDSIDIRVFSVRELNGGIVPPSQVWPSPLPDPQSGQSTAKPNEMNFSGQLQGWHGDGTDGLLNDQLSRHMPPLAGSDGELLTASGGRWTSGVLSSSLVQKDGSVSYTGNQSMGGHKLTTLAAGSTSGESVEYDQMNAAVVAGGIGNTQPSLRLLTIGGVRNIAVNVRTLLSDAPYYVRAADGSTTGTGTASSPNVTLAAASDFQDNDGIFLSNAGPATDLITCPAPTAQVLGTTGGTTRTYYCCGMSVEYGYPIGSAGIAVTNTNATLDDTNFVRVQPPLTPQVDGYVKTNVANLSAFVVAQPIGTAIAGEVWWLTAQTNPGENGPYTVGTVTAGTAPLTRATWCDSAAEATALSGYFVPVRARRGFNDGRDSTPRMLQVTSGTITTLGTNPITTSDNVEWILFFVDDSRTAGLKKFVGATVTRSPWYNNSGTESPVYGIKDTGVTFPGVDNFIPNTLPVAVGKNSLIARVQSGGGTTAIVLDRNVSSTGGYYVRHDNSLGMQAALDAASSNSSSVGAAYELSASTATYRFYRPIYIEKQHEIVGRGRESTVLGFGPGMGVRMHGGSTSRYGSSSFHAKLSRLAITAINSSLPAGGDYMTPTYDGHGISSYDPTTKFYTGGKYSDTPKLSYVQGALLLADVAVILSSLRLSNMRGSGIVLVGTSDDTGNNCNDAIADDVQVTAMTDGHGFVVQGYDASNGRFKGVHVTGGARSFCGIWDQGFTGSNWEACHTESCYLTICVASSASAATFKGTYLEGGQNNARLRAGCSWYGGNLGSNVDVNGGFVNVGGSLQPGVNFAVNTTPNRVYRNFGDTNASVSIIDKIYTEEIAGSYGLYTAWSTINKTLQRYWSSTGFIVSEVATQSSKIFGGEWFRRGLLQGPSNTTRRAWRGLNGTPDTSLNMAFEPGDFLVDINTGGILKAKVRCVSTTVIWGATTSYTIGAVIVPTTNNTKNRGFVVTSMVSGGSGGTSGSSQPNWDAVTDNVTTTDSGVVWTAWGTDGSGTPQFDLWTSTTDQFGANLTDADLTITIAQGSNRKLPTGILSADRTITLSTTGAVKGQTIKVERLDVSSFKLNVVGASTWVLQGGREGWVQFLYDGSVWQVHEFGAHEVRNLISTGALLTDADATITVAQGNRRILRAGTLSANRNLTLSVSGAVLGDTLLLEIEAQSSTYTYAIIDAPGPTTRYTVPANTALFVEITYDGTNWGAGAGTFKKWALAS